ncbi:uncharacterized protein LOC143265013 isoform X2 [Megachile rotundata]|uniref:uncharacterized protein LOC143265013 isoform X2 n=1 Tax=Megachile rotundata TaxID=143995 RepID=UPI003FD5B9D0
MVLFSSGYLVHSPSFDYAQTRYANYIPTFKRSTLLYWTSTQNNLCTHVTIWFEQRNNR